MLFDFFAAQVFPPEKMAEFTQAELTEERADRAAKAMQDWALSLGATHYCHWFQPLTGATAEKHMSFVAPFTGKQLLLGESDASSFPTGGLRGTAYARGFTAWDRKSPVFLKDTAAGRVLCIPTVFYSSNGDALDVKTPLLRSMEVLNTQALRLLRLFGKKPESVTPMVGAEQEYYLLDRQAFLRRRDLKLCGRTLFGAPPPKGQEMDDRYYAAIGDRPGAFMKELNRQLWLLGIPAVAQHNEVAPAQHELAPQYAPAHIASDRDLLTMERMDYVARRQGLACLLHEKPFAHFNGSGKHNNWSLETDTGENLLDPGPKPEENLQFQLILSCLLKGVWAHPGLLRLSAGSVGNDARLGGQEAPPAIVSVFLGDRLDSLVRGILQGNSPRTFPQTEDRNRTAPLAFTGNKFEFRMVGASDCIAMANTVLNAIAAESFRQACDGLEQADNFPEACKKWIRQNLEAAQPILFSGDSYSDAWFQEAKARGLPHYASVLDALPELTAPRTKALFCKSGIFTETELESRKNVMEELYLKSRAIQVRTMLSVVRQDILPAAGAYAAALGDQKWEKMLYSQLEALMQTLWEDCRHLQEEKSLSAMGKLRRSADALEVCIPGKYWPMPTYEELLFQL